MSFTITPNVQVTRDIEGRVRALAHLQQPYSTAAFVQQAARTIASQYVRDVAGIYGFASAWLTLTALELAPMEHITVEGTRLRLVGERSVMETTVVSFAQTHFGLPVWEAGVSVTGHGSPFRITSSSSSVHYEIKIKAPATDAKYLPEKIDLKTLFGLLVSGTEADITKGAVSERLRINGKQLRVFRYDPKLRFDPESDLEQQKQVAFQSGPPRLPLAAVATEIEPGIHYVVTDVLFTFPVAGLSGLNWRAFVEVETGSILYLRAFTACATGLIYPFDPLTTSGTAVKADAGDPALDPLRSSVGLPGVTPPTGGAPWALTGDFVQVSDFSPPNIAPPTDPAGNFSYHVSTDNFSAVNCYYHVDQMFRLVQGMGFSIPSYFSGTTFPVPADHRATVFGATNTVNAAANGTVGNTGLASFVFALEELNTSVGIADDLRVVAHEFGHCVLYNHIHSPNFGFAHSMGDSLAVILADPASQAPDRFDSFPWITLSAGFGRRHDRAVAAGWAWGGVNDTGGYNSEQILSTTHFRIYQAIGGDDTRLDRRQLASRYMLYLIFRAAASLGPSPVVATPTPDIWATALINADNGSANFEGQPGGAYNKVIRWGFEKQGLYQLPGTPTPITTQGAPPAVDVYIDDGRGGEYPYLSDFWENTEIWNRLMPDAGSTHQTPIVSVPNYGYVQVKNRGTQTANNVVVRGYHCRPSAGLTWPDDWQAMDTPSVNAPGPIPPGGSVIVGPFQWTPSEVGHECMLMSVSADGDLSNIDPTSTLPCQAGPTAHWRLVPYDNNLGQRNVAPVAGGGGFSGLSESFAGRHFFISNPFDRAVQISIEVELPPFLKQKKWNVRFLNPGGSTFTLGPRATREIQLGMIVGDDFSADEVRYAARKNRIVMRAVAGGIVIGGISYELDPNLRAPAQERPSATPDCREAAHQLLRCLKLPSVRVDCVRVKKITLDISFEDDCC